MILNDNEIAKLSNQFAHDPMINPFVEKKSRMGSLSYGLGHFGYDIRVEGNVRVPIVSEDRWGTPECQYVNPANEKYTHIDDIEWREQPLNETVLRPGEFVLIGTLEYFQMPNDVMALVKDKSTLARLGLAVQNTVLEPGWCGHLTVEVSNHGELDVQLTDKMPIAQVMFFKGNTPSQLYDGRYQNQERNAPAKEWKE